MGASRAPYRRLSGYLIVSLEQPVNASKPLPASRAHHDAQVVSEAFAARRSPACFAVGELGPIGGHNFIHGFTTSIVLLSKR